MNRFRKWRCRQDSGGISISFLRFLVVFLVLFPLAPASHAKSGEKNAAYLEEVLADAREKRLHEERYWQVLVHYRKGVFGVKSIVDDPRFFLAEKGRTDPEAELEATIRAFFEPADSGKESAVCRFVARFAWIRDRLDLDVSRLPIPACTEFEAFMEENEPKSASLAFPTSHINSPASMFGHTMLTIETKDKTNLLAHSVSYAAETDDSFGPLFAVKGLVGLYRGDFSVLPYYAKLQQYNDVDHRDIWEYRLNLSEEEIRRMMLHIREWETVGCRYYFFTRNCSYLLFLLLEAARPEADLTEKRHLWVIPLDSIRFLKDAGFMDKDNFSYRPSRTTKIAHLISRTPGAGEDVALTLANGESGEELKSLHAGGDLSEEEKRLACELAAEYVQYLYTKGAIGRDVYRERYLRVLGMRSRQGVSGDDDLYRIQTPVPPHKGHRSARLALGGGRSGGDAFFELRLRPAYHHLMDDATGYVDNSQIVFADTALRLDPDAGTLRLESFDLIDIVSISPRNRFFKPLSWTFSTGLVRMEDGDGEGRSLVYRFNPGSGVAYGSDVLGSWYAMLETQGDFGNPLDRRYAAGVGASTGVVRPFLNNSKMQVYAKNIYYGLGEEFNAFEAGVALNIAQGPDSALSLHVMRKRERGVYRSEAAVFFNLFF